MNINIQYIVKFWDYLRKLFKPEREGVLLSKKDTELPEWAFAKNVFKNNIAHATNCSLIARLYDAGEAMVILRDRLAPEYGLARQSMGRSLIADRQYTEQTVIKEHRKGKQGVTESARRSLQEVKNKPRNGNELAMKCQTNGNESAINKQGNTKEIAEGKQRKTRKMERLINSNFFLTNLTPTSKFLRLGFDSASGFHRLQCMKSRRIVEQKSSGSRKRGEERVEKVSSNLLDVANSKLRHCLGGTRYLPAFNPFRTLFYLRSSMHRMCTVPLPSLHQEKDGATTVQVWCSYGETCYKGKRRLKESPNKIRTNGFAFFMIFMKNVLAKIGLAVRSVYGLFTNALLKRYQKGTANVPESYQRDTEDGSLAVLGLACARLVWKFSFPCIAQASVMRMLSTGKAWIVRKTVPIYALLTHYQRFIYASSILNPYKESALSKIRGFKRSNLFCQASEWFCINNLSNRLKCFSNQVQGGVRDVVNEGFVKRSLKSTFSPVLLLLLMMTFGSVSAQAQNKQNYVLQGTVISAVDKNPLQAVSVRVEADNVKTSTKKDGSFSISISQRTGKVKFTSVGYKTQELEYTSGTVLHVQLNPVENQLDEVEVVSTGYQKIPKERATGSFEFVDNKLFNRKVSTDFVSRLEDIVPSISTNKTYAPSRGKLLGINIRGTSTMDWNVWPLVVIDGVPYQNNFDPLNGSFNNINPNDIENITVLKDAAASSIWGAQSGNGVIVITTKRGKYNQPFQLSVNSNVTIAQKPDLYYYPQMNTSDYIDLEKELFDKGYWNSRINRYDVNLTPVIQLLKKHKEGDLSQMDLNQQLDALRAIDMREDFLKYIYRESVNQQYNVQLSGGSEKMNTTFSIGYDKNLANLVTSSYNRLIVKNNTQLRPIKNLTLDLGITYTESKRKDAMANMVGYNSMGRGAGNFPYMRMADDNGKPLIVDAIGYNPIFRDTVAGGRLLDWKYRPLEELDDTHLLTNIRETFLNFKAKYQILPSISASVLYAYQRAYQPTDEWQGLGSVHLRETINYRASWNKDKVIWNLPVGDYLNTSHRNNDTYQIRNQLDFHKKWNELHEISAIGGAEVRQIRTTVQNAVYWGYDPELLTHQPVQNGKLIPALNGISGSLYLRDFANMAASTNRYTSFFANANYTYNDRYIISGSVRKDASNLFGVKSNGRGQPFWSIGGSWLLSKESFINDQLFPLLKLRATYGYNGNVNNSTAAYPIISIQTSPDYITGQPYASMQSPPNPSLRWERVGMLNLGLDFSFKNRISGSLEYYIKRPKDLIASAKIDPTTGYSSLNVNSANLDGRGVDISLNSVNIKSNHFNWTSNLVFAYNRTKVLKSYLTSTRGKDYITGPYGMTMTPIEGMQLYSLLTYKWAGLNPETGMPRGFVNGEVSEDYSTIVNRGTIEDLENHGSLQPVYFGSFRNNFSYKNLELSFNISYQLGHKFLRNSFSNRWFIDNGRGHSDYALRWQKPGDEQQTNVPAFIYPNNLYASELYYYSAALVEPADQIKLRDIQLSYNLHSLNRAGFKNVRLYAYIQNPGTIWRANKLGLDPEFGDAIPDPMSVSLGLNFNL
ncbi:MULTISPECIES: SusC/RagA family TonB-linked outer membrane protein [unclassified Sphingobacterium]|uniref:SusC/RagA family TonB-linked outer membrane protein n=1 Tax=unclassified Sphingobacterium TaxID=2609468 RepID=UPI001051B89F|nr:MULTISPECIES: SusC/RagA family TonB-linked outer membrane protein [unclassified Sphingobacterium]MCS3556942.1 TonB-linked SusC/RagA family outer membrane protein [Sphingobacterium sp. JUb21]TCQ98946.1 TonB-linked SusC/RagA family outer membrane protein [Sphingobacterium sp. JUb20]